MRLLLLARTLYLFNQNTYYGNLWLLILTCTWCLLWNLKTWWLLAPWFVGVTWLCVFLGLVLLNWIQAWLHSVWWMNLVASRFLCFLLNRYVSNKRINKCQIEVTRAPHHLEIYPKTRMLKSLAIGADLAALAWHLAALGISGGVCGVQDWFWNLGLLTLMFIDIYNMFLMLIDLIEASKLI